MLETALTRVLVMEDDATDWLLLEHQMRKLADRLSATRVLRLDEMLQTLASESFDVVITDLYVADSRGLDTLLRICESAPDIPVLVLSSLDDPRLTRQALEHGASDYFVKGKVNGALLDRAIRYAIDSHRMRAELDDLRSENAALRDRLGD